MYIYNIMYHNTLEILMPSCHFMTQFLIPNYIKVKRRDLAKMYFPEMSDVEAVRSLRRWIEGCPKLMSALEELSMPFKKSRNLSARQVRIIMEYLGDP